MSHLPTGPVTPQKAVTLVLTTSYPGFPGDLSGHFVAAEAEALAAHGPVLVVAAGRGQSSHKLSHLRVQWLGGARLCSFPGALLRARSNPLRLVLAPWIMWRAWNALLGHAGNVEAHWLIPFGYLAALAERWTHSSLKVTAHGSDVRLMCRAPRWLRSLIVAELCRANAKITLVSLELKDALKDGLPAKLSRYLEHANVEPARIDLTAAPGSRSQARQRLRLAESDIVLVIVGRLIPSKRVRIALSAAALAAEAQVICVGDGPSQSELMAEFPMVRFVGRCPRPEALTWIAAADALLTASRLEGASTVVREALALGTPVISTASGDLALWTKDHPDLFVVN